MRNKKSFAPVIFAALIFACLQTAALGQTASQSKEIKVASVRAEGMGVRFESAITYTSATLTVSGPDGNVYRQEFGPGTVPSFALLGKTGAALGNGQYTYELRFTTVQMQDLKQRLAAAPDDGVMDENGRTNRGRSSVQSVVQSGSFAVQNGVLYVGNETEPSSRISSTNSLEKNPQQRSPGVLSGNTVNRLRNHRLSLFTMPDQVIADDLIVQGSACIGLDCVNNESFGFDTIRLKENNTRIKFLDTSTAAGFPTHDWQLTANDSASGGAEKFSIEDITAATVPFTITGSSPSNSIFVDSTGRVGFRTGTPVLDLHVATGNTPAHRFEQTSAGGFTAQTWDVAGNEANFFVRDVTGGSRLPFRIRPGAPTSSIDINASGNVGIGTASPGAKLHVNAGGTSALLLGADTDVPSYNVVSLNGSVTDAGHLGLAGGGGIDKALYIDTPTGGSFNFRVNVTSKMLLDSSGNVGIGTTGPTALLSVNGTANKPGGGSWDVFSDERLKNIRGNFNSGLKAVMQLQPIRYEYRKDNALGLKSEGEHVGFGAQALEKIIPEAVTKNSEGYRMVNNDPILWTMLNAIKEQQKEIAELKGQVQKLRAASHRRRR
jgi:Chaperone of endosialidase